MELREIEPQGESQTPELTLLSGGLALEQTVELKSVLPMSFEDFNKSLKESEWAGMSGDELLAIRESMSEYTGELALLIHRLQQDHDAAIAKKININGFIRDRQ